MQVKFQWRLLLLLFCLVEFFSFSFPSFFRSFAIYVYFFFFFLVKAIIIIHVFNPHKEEPPRHTTLPSFQKAIIIKRSGGCVSFCFCYAPYANASKKKKKIICNRWRSVITNGSLNKKNIHLTIGMLFFLRNNECMCVHYTKRHRISIHINFSIG